MGALEKLWLWVLWVCTRPHYFYCPFPDFTTSIVSQSVTNNRCAPSCGGHKRKVKGHIKEISALCPHPVTNCFRRHCQEYKAKWNKLLYCLLHINGQKYARQPAKRMCETAILRCCVKCWRQNLATLVHDPNPCEQHICWRYSRFPYQ